MRRLIALTAILALGLLTSVAVAHHKDGHPNPGNPHGEEADGCDHGATGKPCRPDPQPEHGKDCEEHGNHGGVNEDHCGSVDHPTTTTGPTTTQPPPTMTEPPPTTTEEEPPPPTTTQPSPTTTEEEPPTTTEESPPTTTEEQVPPPNRDRPQPPPTTRDEELPFTGLPLLILILVGSALLGSGILYKKFRN